MARPRKNPGDRKDYHLRVPLSEPQRAAIEEAAKLEGEDKAAWARTILLDAANRRIKEAGKTSGKRA
jgi:hypothetical protein